MAGCNAARERRGTARAWSGVARCALVLLFAPLLLTACGGGDDDTPDACATAVEQDLDDGRYDRALERLDSRACEAGMSREDRELNRAAAWIGKSGFDVGDLIDVVVGIEPPLPTGRQATRILEILAGRDGQARALAFLSQADAAYARMVAAFPDGLRQACRSGNVHLLSDAQLDACFNHGLVAFARFARAMDLLLAGDIVEWISGEGLTCANDRNQTGLPDEAEISACALEVAYTEEFDPATGAGTCRAAGTRNGIETGAVRWQALGGPAALTFRDGEGPFADLDAIRITVEPGGFCTGERVALRLLQAEPPPASVVLTEGYCGLDTTSTCDGPQPGAGCWPCPIARADRSGAITVDDAVVESINVAAESLFVGIPEADVERARETLAGVRDEICAAADAIGEPCPLDEEGLPEIDLRALAALLLR